MLICSSRLLIFDMVDKAFTQKISHWFESEHTDENIREGAMMLLQINNNKHLYQVISFNPQGKLELLKYELRKHLNYRNAGMTLDEVRDYDRKVTPILQVAVDRTTEADEQAPDFIPHLPQLCGDNVVLCPDAIIAKGKREDHNQLPAHIQDIWEANAALWKKIKEHFEACKAYTQSCDRYEGLHAADEGFQQLLGTLKQEYYAYKQGMEVYDHATVSRKSSRPMLPSPPSRSAMRAPTSPRACRRLSSCRRAERQTRLLPCVTRSARECSCLYLPRQNSQLIPLPRFSRQASKCSQLKSR